MQPASYRIGTQQVQAAGGISRAQFAAPHSELRPYITTYYTADIESPDGKQVEDLLHPEWGSVRYVCKGAVRGSVHSEPMQDVPPVTLVGHSSLATRLGCASVRIASFGLLPLGWHYFAGLPASRLADRSINACEVKTRVDFAGLFEAVAAAASLAEIGAIFDQALLQALNRMPKSVRDDAGLIQQLHAALLDPDVASVAEIGERVGIASTQLERLSKRAFGFPPKLLLRRQRFLRTLALLMRQPEAKWGEILDPQYYDQAHFNRDFQRFFGMAPKHYLSLEKPIVLAGAMARMAALGDPLQGLHTPGLG
jgi:AraC-like DNA-binding protein